LAPVAAWAFLMCRPHAAATQAEDRLSIKRNSHTSFAAASDCRTIAIYDYTA